MKNLFVPFLVFANAIVVWGISYFLYLLSDAAEHFQTTDQKKQESFDKLYNQKEHGIISPMEDIPNFPG